MAWAPEALPGQCWPQPKLLPLPTPLTRLTWQFKLLPSCAHVQDFGWWCCLGCAPAFAGGTLPDAQSLDLFLCLRNALGAPLPLTSLTVTLADEQVRCTFLSHTAVVP